MPKSDRYTCMHNLGLHLEMETTFHYHDDTPLMGINGYFDENRVIPMLDVDTTDEVLLERLRITLHNTYKGIWFEVMTTKGYHFINFSPMFKESYENLIVGLMQCDLQDRKFVGYTIAKGYPTLRIGKKKDNPIDVIGFIPTRYIKTEVSAPHYDIYPLPDYFRNLTHTNRIPYTGKIPVLEVYR